MTCVIKYKDNLYFKVKFKLSDYGKSMVFSRAIYCVCPYRFASISMKKTLSFRKFCVYFLIPGMMWWNACRNLALNTVLNFHSKESCKSFITITAIPIFFTAIWKFQVTILLKTFTFRKLSMFSFEWYFLTFWKINGP